ncbi:unnamed protein product [Linum trigynum]|uniref:Uncharacterized protein n=1 Tax=Linum trigynum TaxID=586398 RepID=A0AAV2FB16_9ROSI
MDPMEVEQWLAKVTLTLVKMRADDADRILMTVSLLQDAAYTWSTTQQLVERTHQPSLGQSSCNYSKTTSYRRPTGSGSKGNF